MTENQDENVQYVRPSIEEADLADPNPIQPLAMKSKTANDATGTTYRCLRPKKSTLQDRSKEATSSNKHRSYGGGVRMKEQTYGWYPSAKNVYEERRMGALTPYQVEALYRYRDSKYYSEPFTPEEQGPKTGSAVPSSRTSSRGSQKTNSSSHNRVRSAPVRTIYKPPPKLNIPTPQQCWSTHVPQTEITVMPPSPASSAPSVPTPSPARSTTPLSVHSIQLQRATPPSEIPEMPDHSGHPDKALQKVVRIQSAKFRRESPSIPQRPVRSAGPVRPSPSHQPVNYQQIVWGYPHTPSPVRSPEVHLSSRPSSGHSQRSKSETPTAAKRSPHVTSPKGRPPSGKKTPQRPQAPSPSKMEQYPELDIDRTETPDYLEETRKHGWMMEVHGDPLKIKKISKRLPYTVKCQEPEIQKDPPKIHMENLETFFLNTIPRRPMAFTIDKEWISETIHKKRMELQAKHGMNYRYKNFSFVY